MKNNLRRFVLTFAVLAWACSPSGGEAGAAPALSGTTIEGKSVALSDYAGKVVLVDFWATWCGPCQAEIPELVKLQAALGSKGLVVLGVSMDEEAAEVAPFAKKMKINYPVVLNGGENAPKGWVVPGLPTAYLVGRDGKVVWRQFGSKSLEELSSVVEAALAK